MHDKRWLPGEDINVNWTKRHIHKNSPDAKGTQMNSNKNDTKIYDQCCRYRVSCIKLSNLNTESRVKN